MRSRRSRVRANSRQWTGPHDVDAGDRCRPDCSDVPIVGVMAAPHTTWVNDSFPGIVPSRCGSRTCSGDHDHPFADGLEETFREGVGRRDIDGNDRRRGMTFEPGPHDMTHDESGAAGHEESHRPFHSTTGSFARQVLLLRALAQPDIYPYRPQGSQDAPNSEPAWGRDIDIGDPRCQALVDLEQNAVTVLLKHDLDRRILRWCRWRFARPMIHHSRPSRTSRNSSVAWPARKPRSHQVEGDFRCAMEELPYAKEAAVR